jgi:hypothetical protein
MTETHTNLDPAELTPREARAAKPVKGMPYVLGISIAAVVILFAITLAIFA